MSIPWLTKQYGYKTTVEADLRHVEGLTNLSFKQFLISERLHVDVEINYPLVWNDLQLWRIDIQFERSSIFALFFYKVFFQELINDWSSKHMADLRSFVPFIYEIRTRAQDTEVLLPCNQHNWIDVNSLENNGKRINY
jgi:hypothetical protein